MCKVVSQRSGCCLCVAADFFALALVVMCLCRVSSPSQSKWKIARPPHPISFQVIQHQRRGEMLMGGGGSRSAWLLVVAELCGYWWWQWENQDLLPAATGSVNLSQLWNCNPKHAQPVAEILGFDWQTARHISQQARFAKSVCVNRSAGLLLSMALWVKLACFACLRIAVEAMYIS